MAEEGNLRIYLIVIPICNIGVLCTLLIFDQQQRCEMSVEMN